MSTLDPFGNEAESITIGDLTVENRTDRVELYGSLQITRDKTGLKLAEELKQLIDAVTAVLRADKNLPDHVPIVPPENVDNPFK